MLSLIVGEGGRKVLHQICPLKVRNTRTGECLSTYAGLEGGSQVTCITPKIVTQLGLSVEKEKIDLVTFDGESPTVGNTTVVNFESLVTENGQQASFENHLVCIGQRGDNHPGTGKGVL